MNPSTLRFATRRYAALLLPQFSSVRRLSSVGHRLSALKSGDLSEISSSSSSFVSRFDAIILLLIDDQFTIMEDLKERTQFSAGRTNVSGGPP